MAQLDEADLLKLIDDVYEASLDRGRWGVVLNRLCSLYDGKAILFQQDVARGASGVVESCGFEPSYVQSYAQHYGALNPCLERRARLLAGAVATDDMLVERAVSERSEFYNDWLRPQGLGAAVGAVLEKGPGISVNIAVLRAARRGSITRAEHAFFERLAPHLRRALCLGRKLAATQIGRDLAIDALDRFGTAALVADGEGRCSTRTSGPRITCGLQRLQVVSAFATDACADRPRPTPWRSPQLCVRACSNGLAMCGPPSGGTAPNPRRRRPLVRLGAPILRGQAVGLGAARGAASCARAGGHAVL